MKESLLVRQYSLLFELFDINELIYDMSHSVSSHATWLQSLRDFSLNYEQDGSRDMFKKGEMLPVGIKFD